MLKTNGDQELGIKADFEIDYILLCLLVSVQSIWMCSIIILQGRQRGNEEKGHPCISYKMSPSFICKGWWCANAVCNMLPCAIQWIGIESCATDYSLWPSNHFLCLYFLPVGQMSLWCLMLCSERKVRGTSEISEPNSNVDLVAKVFWLHSQTPKFRLATEVCFAASQLLKPVAFLGLPMKRFFKNDLYGLASVVQP